MISDWDEPETEQAERGHLFAFVHVHAGVMIAADGISIRDD